MPQLERREKIKKSIRRKVEGSTERPRLSVFRSNLHIYAQIVNDETGITLASASSKTLAAAGSKFEVAVAVGNGFTVIVFDEVFTQPLAEKATQNNITKVVFDRNGYLYHGRVKALADAAREGGLSF